MNKTVLIFLLSGYVNLLFSASIQDSLVNALKHAKEDTSKVNLYNNLSFEIFSFEPDSAMLYVDRSIVLAQKLNYVKGESRGNFIKGRILLDKSRNKDCIKYLNRALSLFEDEKTDDKFKGSIRMALGRAYDFTGDYFTSLNHFQKSIELFRSVGYLKGIANSYVNVGIIHYRMKDNAQALEYYRKAETEYLAMKDSIGLVYIYNNIGHLDYELKNYTAAEENYLKGIELSEKIDFENLLSFLHNNLGTLYFDIGEMDKAESTFLKGEEISRKVNDREGLVSSLMALAAINYKEKDIDKYLKDILWSYDEAKQQGNKSLIRETSELLSEMYDFKGDKSMAYRYLNEAYEMQDSLNSNSLVEETNGLEIQFRLKEQKRQEQLEIERRDQKIRNSSLLILSLCGLFAGFLVFKNRQNRAKDELNNQLIKKNDQLIKAEENLAIRNQELEQYIKSNIQLEQFAHFASHDLKSPLRTIASFTGLVKKNIKEGSYEDTDFYLDSIETASQRMNTLVIDLINHAKVNSQLLTIEKFNFTDLVKEVEQNLDFALNDNQIELKIYDSDIEMEADRSKIKQVLENLISNALKFNNGSVAPLIEVKVKDRASDYFVSVSDNGIGIETQYQNKIFKAFNQLHTKRKYEGSGLGLTICKNIIEKHGGKIWVRSQKGEGTEMKFTIPKNAN